MDSVTITCPACGESTTHRATDAVAYDYDAQRWEHGRAALLLLAKQAAEGREAFSTNPEYAAFVRSECARSMALGRHA